MRRPSPATIIASVALFFSLAGTGLAASKYLITSTKQIKPSVIHALKGADGSRGPQGPAGAQGSQGAQGAQGPAGAAGTFNASDVTTVSGASQNIDAGASANFAAQCPAGDTVIAGGWLATSGTPNVSVEGDAPSGTTGWSVTLKNNDTGSATPSPLVAVAVCAA